VTAPGTLAYSRAGTGEPLLLLHGLGSSRRCWDPVLPLLRDRFDVIALDLPGFGESTPFNAGVEPHPAALAAVVASTLRSLGIGACHVAGNSLGGWVGLELAARWPIRSLTLLSPAGLWRRRTPLYCRVSLGAVRLLTRFGGPLLQRLAGSSVARTIMFRQFVGRPARMSPAQARQAIADLGSAPGFAATLRATRYRAYSPQRPLDAPVSVSFGTRDLVLLPGTSRHTETLPAHTEVVPLHGTGHLPMTDDPRAVAALISRTADKPVAPWAVVGVREG
jgi:pimeloyl-ACP methyl ester carboxylesterase